MGQPEGIGVPTCRAHPTFQRTHFKCNVIDLSELQSGRDGIQIFKMLSTASRPYTSISSVDKYTILEM